MILQGEIYGDLARVRRPEKVRPVHVQELQECMKIVDVGELTVWPLRPAASPGVLADRPVTLGESLELVVPITTSKQSVVEQHEGLSLARDPTVQPGAVERCRSGGHSLALRERDVDGHHYDRQDDAYDHQLSQGLAPL